MEFGLADDALRRAIELSNEAAARDALGQLPEAFALYKRALEAWKVVCRFQPNPTLRARLYQRMEEYIGRAEQLKQHLEQQLKHDSSPQSQQRLRLCTATPSSPNSRLSCGKRSALNAVRMLWSPHSLSPGSRSPTATGTAAADVAPAAPAASTGGAATGAGAAPDSGPVQCSSEAAESERIKQKLIHAIVTERPVFKWSDVAGLDAAKEALQEAVVLPSRFPNLFTGERRPWRGILLYGPPGTGKTFLARALAAEADATILTVSAADLVSKWQGESEKLVRSLFELAREKRPSVIFIDEVDSMCGARSESDSESSRRMKTEFLIQMQGINFDLSNVLVLGATNTPWALDGAIRRRFERRIYIPLPNAKARADLIKLCLGRTPHQLTPADLKRLADKLEGFSGSDISVLVRDALFEPIRMCRAATRFKQVVVNNSIFFTPCSPDDPDPTAKLMPLMAVPSDRLLPPTVTMDHFLTALRSARPSVSSEDLLLHAEWTKHFGLEGS